MSRVPVEPWPDIGVAAQRPVSGPAAAGGEATGRAPVWIELTSW